MAESIDQAPANQAVHPFTFFRQEGTFTGTQPAFAVVFANANIQVGRADVHITHNQHRIILLQLGIQVVLQILVELHFGRELGRMVAAFTLWEVAVNHRQVA
ncbi:hypothetical protein D3C75_691710 [compost metagenome]